MCRFLPHIRRYYAKYQTSFFREGEGREEQRREEQRREEKGREGKGVSLGAFVASKNIRVSHNPSIGPLGSKVDIGKRSKEDINQRFHADTTAREWYRKLPILQEASAPLNIQYTDPFGNI